MWMCVRFGEFWCARKANWGKVGKLCQVRLREEGLRSTWLCLAHLRLHTYRGGSVAVSTQSPSVVPSDVARARRKYKQISLCPAEVTAEVAYPYRKCRRKLVTPPEVPAEVAWPHRKCQRKWLAHSGSAGDSDSCPSQGPAKVAPQRTRRASFVCLLHLDL